MSPAARVGATMNAKSEVSHEVLSKACLRTRRDYCATCAVAAASVRVRVSPDPLSER